MKMTIPLMNVNVWKMVIFVLLIRLIALKKVVVSKMQRQSKRRFTRSIKKLLYKHECEDCTGCPYFTKYGEPCSIAKL